MINQYAAADALGQLVREYIRVSERVVWRRYDDIQWEELANTDLSSILTERQVNAVKTAMLVEDHIPDYGREYMRLFSLRDAGSDAIAWENRQITHFIYRWTAEEDRHGHVLEEYLRVGRLVDPVALTDEMVREGRKAYTAPHEDAVQLFTYTVIQEKATQFFYASLRDAVQEPVLREVMNKLAKDESRHAAFFADVVRHKLELHGSKLAGKLKEAVEQFRMPLSDILENYRRQAVNMFRAAPGYTHTAGFDFLERVINKYLDTRSGSTENEFGELLATLQAMQPGKALPSAK